MASCTLAGMNVHLLVFSNPSLFAALSIAHRLFAVCLQSDCGIRFPPPAGPRASETRLTGRLNYFLKTPEDKPLWLHQLSSEWTPVHRQAM
jgi:hypothetical protein